MSPCCSFNAFNGKFGIGVEGVDLGSVSHAATGTESGGIGSRTGIQSEKEANMKKTFCDYEHRVKSIAAVQRSVYVWTQ